MGFQKINIWSRSEKVSRRYVRDTLCSHIQHSQQLQQFIHQSKALLNPKKLIKPKLEHFKHQNPLIRMFEKTKSFEKKRNVIRNSIFLPRVYLSNWKKINSISILVSRGHTRVPNQKFWFLTQGFVTKVYGSKKILKNLQTNFWEIISKKKNKKCKNKISRHPTWADVIWHQVTSDDVRSRH